MLNIVVDFVEVTWAYAHECKFEYKPQLCGGRSCSGAVDVRRNIELVLDASRYGVGEVDMSGSGDYAMSLNEELSDCGVSKNNSIGVGCCPTDSLYPSKVQTGRMGHI